MAMEINARSAKLTSAETRIVDYIMCNPSRFILLAINQVADELEISEATISRFVRHCGFKDYKELKNFSTAYLPGFLADKFDVSVDDSLKRADTRCEGTLSAALRGSVRGYDVCMLKNENINLQKGKVHYAMMPVWLLNTKWHGKNFLFAMNGQTGKLVGDLPVDWVKFWGLFVAIAIPLSIVSSIIAIIIL